MLIIKEIDVVYASKNPSLCILEKTPFSCGFLLFFILFLCAAILENKSI